MLKQTPEKEESDKHKKILMKNEQMDRYIEERETDRLRNGQTEKQKERRQAGRQEYFWEDNWLNLKRIIFRVAIISIKEDSKDGKTIWLGYGSS